MLPPPSCPELFKPLSIGGLAGNRVAHCLCRRLPPSRTTLLCNWAVPRLKRRIFGEPLLQSCWARADVVRGHASWKCLSVKSCQSVNCHRGVVFVGANAGTSSARYYWLGHLPKSSTKWGLTRSWLTLPSIMGTGQFNYWPYLYRGLWEEPYGTNYTYNMWEFSPYWLRRFATHMKGNYTWS